MVINAKRDPVAIPEIELSKVSMQVFLADVEITAIDPTLQERKVILDGIGMSVATDIFAGAVIDRLVVSKLASRHHSRRTFISH